jgi:hypothetical protein
MSDGAEIIEVTDEGFSTFKILQSELKILGRPIRLADVLLVLGLFSSAENQKASNDDIESVMWKGNLRHDRLEGQNEETINFLYELLQ